MGRRIVRCDQHCESRGARARRNELSTRRGRIPGARRADARERHNWQLRAARSAAGDAVDARQCRQFRRRLAARDGVWRVGRRVLGVLASGCAWFQRVRAFLCFDVAVSSVSLLNLLTLHSLFTRAILQSANCDRFDKTFSNSSFSLLTFQRSGDFFIPMQQAVRFSESYLTPIGCANAPE
jgi:hypothetical protein